MPLLPVVLHQGYTSKKLMPTIIVFMAISFSAITRSDFIAPEEVVQSSN